MSWICVSYTLESDALEDICWLNNCQLTFLHCIITALWRWCRSVNFLWLGPLTEIGVVRCWVQGSLLKNHGCAVSSKRMSCSVFGSYSRVMCWCSYRSDACVVLVLFSEEVIQPEVKVFDLLVHLHYNPHFLSWSLDDDWMNEIMDTSDWTEFVPRVAVLGLRVWREGIQGPLNGFRHLLSMHTLWRYLLSTSFWKCQASNKKPVVEQEHARWIIQYGRQDVVVTWGEFQHHQFHQ